MNQEGAYTGNTYFAVKSAEMRNFRCFSEFFIDFNLEPRKLWLEAEKTKEVGPLTVLVAKNGMGKSAVLDAVRVLFGTYTSAFEYTSPYHLSQKDMRIGLNRDGLLEKAELVSIAGNVLLDDETVAVSRELRGELGRTTTRQVRALSNYGAKLKSDRKSHGENAVEWPLLAYYGTGRLWSEHREQKKQQYLLKRDDYGYVYCFDSGFNFKAVSGWLENAVLLRMTDAGNQVQNEFVFNQLKVVENALEYVLKEEGYLPNLSMDHFFRELALQQVSPDGSCTLVPVSMLSDGVRAVFGLVADIAFRCAKLNPCYGIEAALKTRGIVMIDEVELHLHPAWQQKILDSLQSAFPNIQFIVSTHSPQLISAIPKECVRIIDGGKVIHPDSPTQGVEVKDILESVFGTSSTPQNMDIVEKFNRLSSLAPQGLGHTEEWDSLYAILLDYYGADYAPLRGIVEHRDFLDRMNREGR